MDGASLLPGPLSDFAEKGRRDPRITQAYVEVTYRTAADSRVYIGGVYEKSYMAAGAVTGSRKYYDALGPMKNLLLIMMFVALMASAASSRCGSRQPVGFDGYLPADAIELSRGFVQGGQTPPELFWLVGTDVAFADYAVEARNFYRELGWQVFPDQNSVELTPGAYFIAPKRARCVSVFDLTEKNSHTAVFRRHIEDADPDAFDFESEYKNLLYINEGICL